MRRGDNLLIKFRRLFFLSFFSFVCACLSLCMVPFVGDASQGAVRVTVFLTSAVFWVGLIVGTVLIIKMNRLCKKIEKQLRQNNQKTFELLRIGVISFFRNKYAAVADLCMILFIVILIAALIINRTSDEFYIFNLVMLILSFISHSFLNGKSFMYILKYEEYRKRKKTNK